MALIHLFIAFFKVGIVGFGGGIAMLPLIYQSVQDFGFMSADKFTDLVALSQVTPGAIAVNAATYIGYDFAGVFGSLAATIGVIVPSFIILLTVMRFIEKYNENKIVQGIFRGIRPATVGLIASAAVFMANSTLWIGTHAQIIPVCMFLIAGALAIKTKINPVIVTLAMGVAGAFLCS